MPPLGQKRKQPPTFHNFPENRAKQLKKAWVEKTKIKSKWKAQKRKEGLIPSYPAKDVNEEDDHPITRNSGSDSESDGHSQDSHNESDAVEEEALDPDTGSSDSIIASPHRTTLPLPRRVQQEEQKRKPRHDGRHSKVIPQVRNRNQPPAEEEEKPSIRELFQTAYSRSSLHTFKADPLKRRRGGHSQQDTRGGRGRGAAPSRGRGQPNMKLRMNAMLEKIKQDYGHDS